MVDFQQISTTTQPQPSFLSMSKEWQRKKQTSFNYLGFSKLVKRQNLIWDLSMSTLSPLLYGNMHTGHFVSPLLLDPGPYFYVGPNLSMAIINLDPHPCLYKLDPWRDLFMNIINHFNPLGYIHTVCPQVEAVIPRWCLHYGLSCRSDPSDYTAA